MRLFILLSAPALLVACQKGAEAPSANQMAPFSDVAVGNAATAHLAEPVPVGVNGRTSRFTKLTVAGCKLVEEYEEGGGWLRTCPGVDGKQVRWLQSDAREDLMFGEGDDSVGLNQHVAKGAFASLGETLDWRGSAGGAADALVVRVNVAQPDSGKPDISRLAVIRLAGTPCVVAVVEPGPQQNAKARAIADGALPACLQ